MDNIAISPAAERNKEPILNILREYLQETESVLLEIGSGTGQHAIHFAKNLPLCQWWASDRQENFPKIEAAFAENKISNINGPLSFEIGEDSWPDPSFSAIFTANTFHIMHWGTVEKTVDLAGQNVDKGTLFFVYGPFNYNGTFTSDSNKKFHQLLQDQDSHMGIRNFEDVDFLMQQHEFSLICDHEMPSNNRLLAYRKVEH